VWGFWITSLCLFYVLLLAFLVLGFGRIFPEWRRQPLSQAVPAFVIVVLLIFGVGIVMPVFLFRDTAVGLNDRFPLLVRSTDTAALILYTMKQYWPLVLTMIVAHWRVLAPPRSQPELIFLPFLLAFVVLWLVHVLAGVLSALTWALGQLGIDGGTFLTCVVLAIAYLPLEPLLRRLITKLKTEYEAAKAARDLKPPPSSSSG